MALEAFTDLVALLTEGAWHGLGRFDQTRLLAEFSGMAGIAAACAIEQGDPIRAVELLEQGRAVLFGQALDSRTDEACWTSGIPSLPSGSGRSFASWSVRTGANRSTLPRVELATERARRFRLLAQRRNALLDQIRALPDLSGFLLPAEFPALSAAAATGPVIMVNVVTIKHGLRIFGLSLVRV